MSYLENFNPPALPEEAGSLHFQMYMGHLLNGRIIPKHLIRLLTTYIVTADKAVRGYKAGCKRMEDCIKRRGNPIAAHIEALGEFENCINSIKRAIRIFDLIVRQRDGIEFDRVKRGFVKKYGEKITPLRNAIEHIDQNLEGSQEGEAHLLVISRDGNNFEIGAHVFSVAELGSAVALLYTVGVEILQTLPSTPGLNFGPPVESHQVAQK